MHNIFNENEHGHLVLTGVCCQLLIQDRSGEPASARSLLILVFVSIYV